MKESDDDRNTSYLKIVEEILKDMKFGSISIIVQDGKVVQVDKNEKIRIKD